MLHRMYGLADFRRNRTLADFVASLASLPLAYQPGEVWEYSWGVDVLARVIEVVSGQSFDQFLDNRTFKPLHMVDAGFFVPMEERRASSIRSPADGQHFGMSPSQPSFSWAAVAWSRPRPTICAFVEMLLNGGNSTACVCLSAKTVQQMTTNALPPDVRFAGDVGRIVGPRVGTGWGLGFARFAPTLTSASCRALSAVLTGAVTGAHLF